MRIRKPFAAVFVGLILFAGYLGLAPITIPYGEYHADKVVHFVTFFLVTLTFYWIFETTRRRTLNMTLLVCTILLGVGSEILQELLDNGRNFDFLDIAFNVVGSLSAIGLCAWYHRRMLERKRITKGYRTAEGADASAGGDVELGEGTGPQETGVTGGSGGGQSMDEELDRWDENAEDDWEDDDKAARDKSNPSANGGAVEGKSGAAEAGESKQRGE